MVQVNIREAKTQLSRLLKLVEAGEEVVIARNGVPVARLVAVPRKARKPSLWFHEGAHRVRRELL